MRSHYGTTSRKAIPGRGFHTPGILRTKYKGTTSYGKVHCSGLYKVWASLLSHYSKNPSVEVYPASVQNENKWLRETFQKMEQIDQQVIDQRDTANKKVQYLTQSNTQKDREMKSLNLEKEQLRKQVSERDQTIQDLASINDHVNQENKKLKSQDEQENLDQKRYSQNFKNTRQI